MKKARMKVKPRKRERIGVTVHGGPFVASVLDSQKKKIEEAVDKAVREVAHEALRRPWPINLGEAAREVVDQAAAPPQPRKRRTAPTFDLIPSGPLRRIADRYQMGAEKYGRDAWRDGLSELDTLNHALDHLLMYRDKLEAYRRGGPDRRREDDDLAGAAWGCITLMAYQDR